MKKDLFNAEDSPIAVTKSKNDQGPRQRQKDTFEQVMGDAFDEKNKMMSRTMGKES